MRCQQVFLVFFKLLLLCMVLCTVSKIIIKIPILVSPPAHSEDLYLQQLRTAYRIKGKVSSLILSYGPTWFSRNPSGLFLTHLWVPSGLTDVPTWGL